MANGVFAQFTVLTAVTEPLIVETWTHFYRCRILIIDAFSLPLLDTVIRHKLASMSITGRTLKAYYIS